MIFFVKQPKTNNKYHYNYIKGQYYILDDKFLLTSDGVNNKNLYLYKEDILLKENVIKKYNMEAIYLPSWIREHIESDNNMQN